MGSRDDFWISNISRTDPLRRKSYLGESHEKLHVWDGTASGAKARQEGRGAGWMAAGRLCCSCWHSLPGNRERALEPRAPRTCPPHPLACILALSHFHCSLRRGRSPRCVQIMEQVVLVGTTCWLTPINTFDLSINDI